MLHLLFSLQNFSAVSPGRARWPFQWPAGGSIHSAAPGPSGLPDGGPVRPCGRDSSFRWESLSALRGKVIATGGGAILREENRIALKENSTVIFLKSDINSLATDGRPLSKDTETLKKMLSIRLPLYLETADIVIDVDPDPEETLRRIKL